MFFKIITGTTGLLAASDSGQDGVGGRATECLNINNQVDLSIRRESPMFKQNKKTKQVEVV
ncbi:hypothetical protein HanPI659440_Chr12g0467601 [Helianthus annuus]|nr:hypothetical protein HanPI659440_Chr12g0467601 [Helianthus annuus]